MLHGGLWGCWLLLELLLRAAMAARRSVGCRLTLHRRPVQVLLGACMLGDLRAWWARFRPGRAAQTEGHRASGHSSPRFGRTQMAYLALTK